MSPDTSGSNAYLTAPVGAIIVRTALPIIFVMSMNGLLTVTDAVMLGIYVGPDAVGAVTAVFPLFMLLVALTVLVSGGMASLLARHLGAGNINVARSVLATAHRLALAIAVALIVLFLCFGEATVLTLTNGPGTLGGMAFAYISIVVLSCPLQFVLAVNADALRCEGRAGLMALTSLFVSVANLGFNYALIVWMGLGVAGSAYGTVLAQALALVLLFLFRTFGKTALDSSSLIRARLTGSRRIVALGAPQSLGFVGLAIVSAAIIAALQAVAENRYDVVVAAYGIITRVMTFAFLPLLGLSQAMQAIVGNNVGAGLLPRSNRALLVVMAAALVYCLAVEAVLVAFAGSIGPLFVGDGPVAAEVARILPVLVTMYFVSGPLLIVGSYFQALGDAARAAILSLAKPYLFTVPLVVIFAASYGEQGIWYATPVAEAMLLVLTLIVLALTARRRNLGWGLFLAPRLGPAPSTSG
ncbi:MAG: MATE family efflux transporter [Mesorhizobium sp.]|nr:MATE family efflux transporter [Mesorhizobium sp.]